MCVCVCIKGNVIQHHTHMLLCVSVIGNVAGFLHHDALSTSVPAKADCMPPPPDVVLRRRKDSGQYVHDSVSMGGV